MKKIALVLAAAAGLYSFVAAPASAQTMQPGIHRDAMDANAQMMGDRMERRMMRRHMERKMMRRMVRHDMRRRMMRREMMR